MNEVVDGLVRESEIDFIALPEIIGASRQCLGIREVDQVRKTSLEIARNLYERGLRPGNYDLATRFDYWPDNGCQAMIDRIEREWAALGKEPNLEEPICWFARARREI